ncbi:MAG TPA: phosphate/phosphite/phosphonate ABC transporter substrate-binding protein [Candidatus Binatia bacterium]|jgi:phosphonate transport system substrate-binding protein
MNRQALTFSIALAAITFLLCASDAAGTITLGLVSEVKQKEIAEHFRDFARYVARKLHAPTGAEGEVVVTPTLSELAKLIDQGKIDFFMESPYPTYVVNHIHGVAKLVLRRWKGGKAEYRSLIATNKQGGTSRIQDLRGKIIAFEDPESTSGYFLPKFFLQRNGFKLVQVSSLSVNVPSTEVGYLFAKTRDVLVEWVVSKQVAAGAISDDDYAMLDEKRKANLNILAQTELLPRHLVSVRKNLAPEMIERLERVLQSMHADEEGQTILRKIDTTKFDLLPGGEEVMRRRLLDTFHSPEKK